MNIVTPLHTAIPYSNSNLNTDQIRRDNQQKEVIPQPSQSENSAAESGLGSESDRVRQPGQAPQPVVYEKPTAQQQVNPQGQQADGNNQDNANDPSAGKQDAEQQRQQQAEAREIEQLEKRDAEVRAHEQAHANTGGEHAGAPQYEFEQGPDGKRYAVGGEVSIDISAEDTPEDTIRKMQQVRSAALAPAEPSPADLRVAAEATQLAAEARADLVREAQAEREQVFNQVFNPDAVDQQGPGPSLEDIVVSGNASPPRRSLEQDDPVAEAGGAEVSAQSPRRSLKSEPDPVAEAGGAEVSLESPREVPAELAQRALRIENYYANVAEAKTQSLSLTA
ncbi:putative metalloprotease CJM1_0395 family protein [Bowmanella sp. JS7-9]|uniref:Metalloprotease CJM1_0395 family protein n=1 Tax=Pseudobowmanella zhangzhouensis TaxID=1537679 RepID=A0ABW1XEZ9_9ALTE|nr:putative metalloprotease CJM1_0395 family protein [Bowmanella sp. JS7-9]TBX20921.1 hypothetical protein TK45_14260 [Bowmanella sp. JS7-9]